jgi:ferrous iron transport protein B
LPPRWLAVKLLEEDPRTIELVKNFCPSGTLIVNLAAQAVKQLTVTLRRTPALAIIENRYGFTSSICRQVVSASIIRRISISDNIDLVLTNRLLGLPIFFLLMYLLFFLTFSFGSRPSGWVNSAVHQLGAMVNITDGPLQSLLVNGILAGVGNVLAFMPNIFILFLAIAILEDTGYLARVAFLMDRIMRNIGLNGKSFIPMMIGMGCSVPAIMATRTLENEDDRLTTIMVIPLMSCSARLPIYALIIPAFFPLQWQAPMLWMVYLTGIGLMMLSARFIRRRLQPESGSSLVMELPPYRLPTLKGVFFHMWERSRLYLKKAGTIIFALSIVFWALTNYPKAPEDYLQQFSNPEIRREAALSYSAAGRLGHALEPLIRPLGFDWRIGTALVGACAAKEIFIAQLGIIFAVDKKPTTNLGDELRRRYTPLTGLCIILFNLISLPCLATLAATRQETNSWRWPLLQLSGLTLLAWLITFIVYQTGLIVTGITV